MSKYIVRDVVCEWGICSVDDLGEEELVEVCNSKANAELICEILNADLIKDGKYTIWKDKKISDLEAKLKALQNGIIDDETLCSLVREHKLYKELEAKLAEKDEEIEEWIAVRDDKNKVINKQTDKINKLKEELKAKETLNQIFKDNRKAKISFAVEQLEKVKELLLSKAIQITGTSVDTVRLYSINEIFENQIKQLKEYQK